MPGRILPLVNNEIYHVYNRGIDHRPTFTNNSEYQRALITIKFYRFSSPPIRLSYLLNMETSQREKILSDLLSKGEPMVEFLSFCFMPNHFHFLLKQLMSGGISHFMSNFQNSFTRYFNTKHQRIGPLFLDQFKAKRIETEEQFLHVSRYIHLNPFSSFVVKNLEDLEAYQWSSLPEYLSQSKEQFCSKELLFTAFKNKSDFQRFVFDQADYQRELDRIKHLLIE